MKNHFSRQLFNYQIFAFIHYIIETKLSYLFSNRFFYAFEGTKNSWRKKWNSWTWLKLKIWLLIWWKPTNNFKRI